MQGQIQVDSEPGQGSVFRFVVRFDRAEATSEELQPAPLPVQTQSRLNILLAEDNPTNQKFAIAVLAKAGHAITLAKNGQEAVEQARNNRFDLILMDIEMPLLDGFGATQAIRASGVNTPIIALTAHAILGFRERCLAVGMTDYVTKPIRRRDLLEKLGHFPGQPNVSTIETMEEAEKPAESPVLDTVSALELLDGDTSILHTLLPIVLEQMSADRREIAAAISSKDADRVKKISHRLKGSVGQIGAVRAHRACELLEAAAANGDSATLVDFQRSLNTELDALSPAIKTYIALHPHPES
jgi:CheY-like chemotaxis protein